jgi:hypothetical protein
MANFNREQLRLESDYNYLNREKELMIERFERKKQQLVQELARALPQRRMELIYELTYLTSEHQRQLQTINRQIFDARMLLN